MTQVASITVVILIYNDEIFGKRAIESVLNQTYRNIKIKILNNGSTDNSGKMIQSFLIDPRVEIITNSRNQRSEFAVREALKTDTEFITFLFSDDFYEKNRLEYMYEYLAQNRGLAAVFSSNTYLTEDGLEISSFASPVNLDISVLSTEEHLFEMLLVGNSLHPCSMLIRTDVYKKIGGFKGYLHRIGDLTFFASLLINFEVLFLEIKLQGITLWKSKRNESSVNSYDYWGIFFERPLFLEAFKTATALNKVELIFPDLKLIMTRDDYSRAERLFFMGYKITNVDAVDYLSVGARFMFEAYEEEPDRIEELSKKHFNKTFAELSYQLSRRPWHGPDAVIYKFMAFLKKQKILVFLYRRFFKKSATKVKNTKNALVTGGSR
jgi:glycosyltransferase involved in cell wall biosynthesis